MTDTRLTDEHAHATDARTGTLKRRGLIAGAAALVTGLIAQRASHVDATNGDPLTVGTAAAGTATTTIAATTAAGVPGLRVTTNFTGTADAIANGVQGFAAGAYTAGVFGRNNDKDGYGVHGEGPAGVGVFGHSSSGYGVVGQSVSLYGIYGNATSNHGIYGEALAATLAGVVGAATGPGAHGVVGTAHGTDTYAGAFYGPVSLNGPTTASVPGAHSLTGHGTGTYLGGVVGSADVAGAYGVLGYGTPAGSYAGYFDGQVVVAGDFAVTGSKSAAVIDPRDGGYRLLYCVESPEAWFEDFGEGTLTNGQATVPLDADFAALIDLTGYHVYLTEHGDHHALFVASRTATSFAVQAKNAPGASGTFGYRVVARRKDGTHPRLAKVAVPDATKITVPPAPTVVVKGVDPTKP